MGSELLMQEGLRLLSLKVFSKIDKEGSSKVAQFCNILAELTHQFAA